MYRVVIVDDEKWTVKGLSKFIEEEDGRFELIYSSTDPTDALEQICSLHPDVVFTDIRMPEMTGIEMMRSVKERGVKTEFVVISGFAEFSYAHEAIQEGAVDYLLKPFNKSYMKEAFDKLYEKLDSKRKLDDFNYFSALRYNKEKSAELLQNKFTSKLYQKLQIVLIEGYSDEKDITFDTGEESQCFLLKFEPGKFVFFINCNEDKTEKICDELSDLENEFKKAAISRLGNSVDMFEQLFKETENTLMDSFIYPGKIFCYREARKDIINRFEEVIKELYLSKKSKQLNEVFTDIKTMFVKNNMGADDAVYLWNRMAAQHSMLKTDTERNLEYFDIYELSERFSNIEELGAYLNMVYEQENTEYSDVAKNRFEELLQDIELNYAQELSLKELCDKYHFNMSYCCVLFQKNKNMTFSQYLTCVRIEKACELLKYYKVSVSEAGERVGYKDYFYFNKVFKKKVGCTPSEYRKSSMMEK